MAALVALIGRIVSMPGFVGMMNATAESVA
jgi:hypothetical protein